jgi:Putative Flp pilus-assembly TadE/G-like
MKIIRKAITAVRALRPLAREKRGNAVVILGASLPLLVGSMGLGVDFTQWVVHKRSMQGAADSAALAGARTRWAGVDAAGVTTEATKVINSNSAITRTSTAVNLLASPSQPSGTSNPTSVEVVLEAQGRLYFAGLFLSSRPTIRTRAVAGPRGFGEHCFLALDPTAAQAFAVRGNSTVTTDCGVMSNSNSASAFYLEGQGRLTTTASADTVGGITESGANATLTAASENTGTIAQDDPFGPRGRNLQPPSCPAHVPLVVAAGTILSGGTAACHSIGSAGVHFEGGPYTLQPGVHVFHGTGPVRIAGSATVTGAGVAIVLTGGAYLVVEGGSNLNLRAMTTDEAAQQPDAERRALAGVLVFQSGNSTQGHSVAGGANIALNGAIYTPNTSFTMTGNMSAASRCLQLVANTINITGSASLPNDCSGLPGLDGFATMRIVLAE